MRNAFWQGFCNPVRPPERAPRGKTMDLHLFNVIFHVIASSSSRRTETAPGAQRAPQDASSGPQKAHERPKRA